MKLYESAFEAAYPAREEGLEVTLELAVESVLGALITEFEDRERRARDNGMLGVASGWQQAAALCREQQQ